MIFTPGRRATATDREPVVARRRCGPGGRRARASAWTDGPATPVRFFSLFLPAGPVKDS